MKEGGDFNFYRPPGSKFRRRMKCWVGLHKDIEETKKGMKRNLKWGGGGLKIDTTLVYLRLKELCLHQKLAGYRRWFLAIYHKMYDDYTLNAIFLALKECGI